MDEEESKRKKEKFVAIVNLSVVAFQFAVILALFASSIVRSVDLLEGIS